MTKKKSQKKNKKLTLRQFITNHCFNIRNCGYLSNFKFDTLSTINKGADMQITVDHTYLCFHLEYNKPKMTKAYKDGDYEYIVQTLCHEMAHLVTTEFRDNLNIESKPKTVTYYLERVTELTSRWLYNSYKRYMDERKINIKTGKCK